MDIWGCGFFKFFFEFVLLIWENELIVIVCVLLERFKEIDIKGNLVLLEKLCKIDNVWLWVLKGGK